MIPSKKRLALAVAALLASAAASADNFTLKIGSGHPVNGFAYVMAADDYFVPEVARRAAAKGHTVRFVKAFGGSVAKVDAIVEAVQSGTFDIGLSVPPFEPSRMPLLNFAFNAPFVSSDPLVTQKVANRMLQEVPALQESMKPYNIQVLNLTVQEPYGVISTFDWSRIEQIKGRKFGVAASNGPLYAAAGVTPVIVPAPEAYMALKTGMIDGQVFFASGMQSFRLYEVAKYFILTGQGSYVGGAMLMNTDARKKLPAALVEIIDAVALETATRAADISKKRAEEAAEKIKAQGVKFIVLDDSQKRIWMHAAQPLAAQAVADANQRGLKGAQVYAAYIRFMTEAGYEFPVKYGF
jgi:TRAP-type C4-dicarboxylate transport system substrate-binding protein